MKRQSWMASAGLGALLAVGCGGELPGFTRTNLEVEVQAMTADVQGSPVTMARVAETVGFRDHDTGQFFVRSEDGATMVVTVCPLGELQINPYGGDEGGERGGGGPFPVDAGAGEPRDFDPALERRREPSFASHCEQPSVSVCAEGGCIDLAHGQVQARVTELAGWRQIVVDGVGDQGSVALELRYRELR